jgi:hypothetical protein
LKSENAALAVVCERDGVILEFIHDELGVHQRFGPGRAFGGLVAPSDWRKANRFLRTIHAAHTALDWELIVTLPHGSVPLFFSGCVAGHGIVVIGTKEPFLDRDVPDALRLLTGKSPKGVAAALDQLRRQKEDAVRGKRRLERELPHFTPAPGEAHGDSGRGPRADQQQWQLETAAHDLRNPISGVLAAAQYLIEDAGETMEAHQLALLRSIESSARFMFLLLDEMVDAANSRAAETAEIQWNSTDLGAVIEHAVQTIRWLAEARRVRVNSGHGLALPPVAVDPVKLAGALERLLMSAIRSSPPEGQVDIQAEAEGDQAIITIRHEPETTPSELLRSLFYPSAGAGRQGRVSDERDEQALGYVRRIVAAHGGTLQTEGNPRQPSTVVLRLPVFGTAKSQERKKPGHVDQEKTRRHA